MSTAKVKESTAKPVPQGEEAAALTAADFAAILSSTLALATEAGLAVGVRNRAAADGRPAGLLIFVEGLTAGNDGRLAAPPALDVLTIERVEGHAENGANAAVLDSQGA